MAAPAEGVPSIDRRLPNHLPAVGVGAPLSRLEPAASEGRDPRSGTPGLHSHSPRLSTSPGSALGSNPGSGHGFSNAGSRTHVAAPLPVLVRGQHSPLQSWSASRRGSEQTLTHQPSPGPFSAESVKHARTFSHSPEEQYRAQGRRSQPVSPPLEQTYEGDYAHEYWAAGVKPARDVEYYQKHARDIGTSPTSPPSFPSVSSGERLIITTRKEYDPEALNHDDADGRGERSTTLPALIHLAVFASLLSFAIAIYTFGVLVILVLTSPLRLCISGSASLRENTAALLLPSLNFQRRCIFADPIVPTEPKLLPPHKSQTEGSSAHATSATSEPQRPHHALPCKTSSLILTHVISPFISLPLTLCAWITALAWLPSAMIIHEETAGVSDDEQRMAERLVGAWFRWLDWCRCEEVEERGRGRERRRRRREKPGGG